jgi:seipin
MYGKNLNREDFEKKMFDLKLLSFMFKLFINVADPFHIIRNYVLKPASESASKLYEDYKAKVIDKLDSSQSFILRLVVIFMIGFLLFCGAILLYILFYLIYMPTSTYVKPVHMQYNKICENMKCDIEGETSPFHSYPIAHLSLTRSQQMMVDLPYIIKVKIEVPETQRNRDLGVFMICIDMKDKENVLKSHSCRSTMLRYHSDLLAKFKMILFLPFYLTGLYEEKQVLDVEMYSRYIDTKNSVSEINVEIQSKVLEFYEVKMEISAHFTGLRYIIHNYPTICATIGIIFNFIVLVIATLILWYRYDYDMDWIDETKDKILRKDSSSISTTDENISVIDSLEQDKLEDEDFIFGMSDDVLVTNESGVRKRTLKNIQHSITEE